MKANRTHTRGAAAAASPSQKEDIAVRPCWSYIDASLSYLKNKPDLWDYANQTMKVCARDVSVMLNLNLQKEIFSIKFYFKNNRLFHYQHRSGLTEGK